MDLWQQPKQSTILVITGDQATRDAFHEEGLASRYRIVEATSVGKGFDLAWQERPDLVLLDVEGANRQRLEFCKALRTDAKVGHVPIVILARVEDMDMIRMGHLVGITDLIVKPFATKILRHRLDYLLEAAAEHQRLSHALTLMAEAQHFARIGTWEWSPALRILEFSDEARSILGMPKSAGGGTVDLLLKNVPAADRPRVSGWLEDASTGGHHSTIEHRVCMPDGAERVVRQRAVSTEDFPGAPRTISVVISDISEWRRAEAENRYHARHDALTGLENLDRFLLRLEEAAWVVERSGDRFAILCLGVDNFGRIHESLGHRHSDEVLKRIAKRLQSGLRKTDWFCGLAEDGRIPRLARLEGAHFAILLQPINRVEDMARVATRINRTFSQPIVLGDQEQYLSAHVGVAIYPDDGRNVEELLAKAQTAMNCARAEGRNEPCFSTAEMTEEASTRLALEANLRRALERDEFELYYQPKVDVATGRIAGFEALLRWHHPELGFVPPVKFIPVAEEIGAIVPIGEWVLRTACRQAVEWQSAGFGPFPVSVNVSVEQFRRTNIGAVVAGVVEETGLPPHLLEIELTESGLMADTDTNLVVLRELKELGVLLAVDDFGTGYSSLSYLRQFPIDILKIDRSFVIDLARDSDADAIATTVVNMARGLGLKVIAEGVETEEQLAFLRELGCEEYQGYLFSRPRPASEATALLEQERTASGEGEDAPATGLSGLPASDP